MGKKIINEGLDVFTPLIIDYIGRAQNCLHIFTALLSEYLRKSNCKKRQKEITKLIADLKELNEQETKLNEQEPNLKGNFAERENFVESKLVLFHKFICVGGWKANSANTLLLILLINSIPGYTKEEPKYLHENIIPDLKNKLLNLLHLASKHSEKSRQEIYERKKELTMLQNLSQENPTKEVSKKQVQALKFNIFNKGVSLITAKGLAALLHIPVNGTYILVQNDVTENYSLFVRANKTYEEINTAKWMKFHKFLSACSMPNLSKTQNDELCKIIEEYRLLQQPKAKVNCSKLVLSKYPAITSHFNHRFLGKPNSLDLKKYPLVTALFGHIEDVDSSIELKLLSSS